MPVLTKINTNVIADDAVTAAKIPTDALGATDIAANAIGTSEIATGGVLPANIAYLGDGSGNLSGTITNQQLHFGSAFTLTDDLTVNDNLTLGNVRDDGTGQSITGDGKTITGTGTLTMGGSLEGGEKDRPVTLSKLSTTGSASSATFLRGDYSWQVAGSTSASDLDSGTLAIARMAAGSVIQVIQGTPNTTAYISTSFSEVTCTNYNATINKQISGSSIHAFWSARTNLYQAASTGYTWIYIDWDRTAPSSATFDLCVSYMRNENATGAYDNIYFNNSGQFIDSSSATGNHTYVCHIRGGNAGDGGVSRGMIGDTGKSVITLMEVVT